MNEVSTSLSQNTSVRSSTAAFTETLTGIWERQLRHAPIAPGDNFFDLGGDSSIAVEVFNEIAKSCGRELPPVTIYHAPTIATLAALLEEKANPRLPSLVQLKAGTNGTSKPVFIAANTLCC